MILRGMSSLGYKCLGEYNTERALCNNKVLRIAAEVSDKRPLSHSKNFSRPES